MSNSFDNNLFDTQHTLIGEDRSLEIISRQDVTDEWLEENRVLRDDSMNGRMGDFHLFARVPDIFIEKWAKEGFDVLKHKYSAKEIIAKIKADKVEEFLTSKRSF